MPKQTQRGSQTITVNKLPCGCQRGFTLCPEAVRLWRETGKQYDLAFSDTKVGAWRAYDTSLWDYNNHFNITKFG